MILLCLLFVGLVPRAFGGTDMSSKPLPRIGSKIDAVERRYFGLFPRILGFDSAEVTEFADSSLRFHIHCQRSLSEDTTLALEPLGARELADFLENFETGLAQRIRTPFRFIDSSVAIRPRREFVSREAVVRKLNGERIQGQLLCATDSHIMLWRSPTAYDWRETDRNSELLSYADLDWIRVRGRHTILTGAFVGFLFGFTYGHVASTARTMDHMFPTESEQRWEGVLFGLGTALIGGAMGALSHRGEAYCFHKKNLDFEKTVTALSQQAMMWVTPSPELHAKEMAETP